MSYYVVGSTTFLDEQKQKFCLIDKRVVLALEFISTFEARDVIYIEFRYFKSTGKLNNLHLICEMYTYWSSSSIDYWLIRFFFFQIESCLSNGQ